MWIGRGTFEPEDWQEAFRGQQSKAWVLPTQQRFESNESPGRQIDSRLVMEYEFLSQQGVAQANLEFFTLF